MLDERQLAFAHAFVGKCAGNATQAAIAAGYSSKGASVQGTRLRSNPKVWAEIERLRGRLSDPLPDDAPPDVRELATRAEVLARNVSAAVSASLALDTRTQVRDAMLRIALGESETRRHASGEEYQLPPPRRAEQIAAAGRLAAMEGWDAPAKVGGKIEHAHSGAIGVVPSKEQLETLSDEQIEQQIAELERAKAQAIAQAN